MAESLDAARPSTRRLFRHRVFTVLYLAETQSIIGDQLARLALSVLVFDRTGSTFASATTYAVTFLPAVLGGFALGGLGDRFPRRAVMIVADLLRATAFLVLAVHGLPLAVIFGVLSVAVFLGPAFTSSEVSFLATELAEETFRAAMAVRLATSQVAQVAGFAVAGVAIAVLGARGTLALDAATFALSALAISVGLGAVLRRTRTHRAGPPSPHDTAGADRAPPFAGLWRTDVTRTFLLLSALIGLFVVPEGLAVPFGHAIGAGTARTGVLVAMIPLGSVVGALLIVRVAVARRRQVAGWMAVACGVPLLVSAAHPLWALACATWFVSGVFAAYQVETTTVLVQAIPVELRSTLIGVMSAVLVGAQGVGVVLGGALALEVGAGAAIAICGVTGSALALVVVLGPLRQLVRR